MGVVEWEVGVSCRSRDPVQVRVGRSLLSLIKVDCLAWPCSVGSAGLRLPAELKVILTLCVYVCQ